MDSPKAPLVNKLILVALVGIGACLVVLIAQNRNRAAPEPEPPSAPDQSAAAQWDAERPGVPLVTSEAKLQQRQATQGQSYPRPSTPGPEAVADNESSAQSKTDEPIPPAVDSVIGRVAVTPVGAVQGSAIYRVGAPIIGRVVLSGKPPPEITVALDPVCGRLHDKPLTTRHYVVGDSGGLANVWVHIKNAAGHYPTPTQQVVLDQIACEYQPYVFGVMLKQPIRIRNSDPFLHNVNTVGSVHVAHRFNIAQPTQGREDTKTFSKPELPLKFMCNVHNWMFAYAGVFEHPFFAVTDADGRFEIPPGLAHGRYVLAARHLKAGEVAHELTITEGAAAEPIEIVLKTPSH
jgi:hypothetical protein